MEEFWRYGYVSDLEEDDYDAVDLHEDKPIEKWIETGNYNIGNYKIYEP